MSDSAVVENLPVLTKVKVSILGDLSLKSITSCASGHTTTKFSLNGNDYSYDKCKTNLKIDRNNYLQSVYCSCTSYLH